MRLKDYFTVYAGGDLQKDCFSPNKTDINKYPIFSNSLENYGLFGYTSKPNYLKNSLTITGRGNVGHSFYRSEDFDAIIRLLVLEPKKNVNSKYFNYLINHSVAFPIESTGVPQLTRPQVENTEVNVIHNSTQQDYIVNIMESVDNTIKSLKNKLSKINNLHNGYMNFLFNFNNDEVETYKLKELVGSIKTGKLDANQMTIDGQYRFYTCAKNYYYIDKYAFDGEALLISGNGANVGYIHHYIGKFNAYQRTYVLMNFNCNVLYLKAYLDYFLSKRIATEVRSGNTPYITLNTVTDMVINIPKDTSKQNDIADYYQSFMLEKEKLEKEIIKYENIRDGLMNGIFTGQIDIPENYEEV